MGSRSSSRLPVLLLSAGLVVLGGASACEDEPKTRNASNESGGEGGAPLDPSAGAPDAGQTASPTGGAVNGGAVNGGAVNGGSSSEGGADGGVLNGGAASGGAPGGDAGDATGGVNLGGTDAASGGSPAAGAATAGAGGEGPLSVCPSPPSAGTIAALLIDDLEDLDNGVARMGGRTGYWYTYLDSFGSTIVPKPDTTGTMPLLPGSTLCHSGAACIIISGTTAAADDVAMKYPFAGVGFDFSNAQKPCVYNAGAYSGIKIWARGDVPITIKLNTAATTTPAGGGTCTGALCNAGFSPSGVDVVLTSEWQQIDLNFATAAPPAWAAALAAHPDKATLLSLQLQIPAGQAFTVALDDVTFY